MPRKKWYVGSRNGEHRVFGSVEKPTWKTHGHVFRGVWGPFRSKKTAEWALNHGIWNPHCVTPADAEKLRRQWEKREREWEQLQQQHPEWFTRFVWDDERNCYVKEGA